MLYGRWFKYSILHTLFLYLKNEQLSVLHRLVYSGMRFCTLCCKGSGQGNTIALVVILLLDMTAHV